MVEHISYLTFYLMKIAHGSAGEIGVQWVGFFEADVEECPASFRWPGFQASTVVHTYFLMLEYKMKRFAISILLLLSTLAFAGEKVLYSFQGGTDGAEPDGPPVFDLNGNLYGTTFYGGAYGFGTVFELSPNAQGGWTESVLYSFTGGTDGQYPVAGLVFDDRGSLFGTTYGSNTGNCPPKCGSVFELSPSGKGWTFTLLHAFQGGNDGGGLDGGVAVDSSGNLYGTAEYFGPKRWGTTFELSKNGTKWTLKTLHAFDLGANGGRPAGTLVLGADGAIYGVTLWGGLPDSNAGVFYSLSKGAKGRWEEKILYSFKGRKDGQQVTGLTADDKGRDYAVSDYGNGCVFRLAKNQHGGWTKMAIYRLTGQENASDPSGSVLINDSGDADGLAGGGENRSGSLYLLKHTSDGKFEETLLYSFKGGSDGRGPIGPPVRGVDGNLYGVTLFGTGTGCNGEGCGSVFEFVP